jgi:hypothetical protein
MPDYDETGGWIFSDDYHYWQDTRLSTGARFGGEANIHDCGWAIGLYGFRTDYIGPFCYNPKAASWPVPYPNLDLDGDG